MLRIWNFKRFSRKKNVEAGFTPTLKSRLLRLFPSKWSKTSHDYKKRFSPVQSGQHINCRDLVWGFTAIELVVMLSIVTIISAVVLFSFGGFNLGAALNRSAQELALAIRDAQNRALSVSRIAGVAPKAVGMRITQGSTSYFIFADLNTPSPNGKYDPPPGGPDVKVKSDLNLVRGITVNSLTGYPGGTATPVSIAHIIFVTPSGTAVLNDVNGDPIGDQLDIELADASGNLTKTITVRVSGQVTIK